MELRAELPDPGADSCFLVGKRLFYFIPDSAVLGGVSRVRSGSCVGAEAEKKEVDRIGTNEAILIN